MSRPDMSVVVATRNRADYLRRLIASLRSQTLRTEAFEVIVIDDASTDSTPSILAEAADRGEIRLRALRRADRGGPAIARNMGWREAEADLIAFTDDDCEAAPEWLERMLASATAHPGSGIQGRTDVNPAERDSVGPFSRVLEVSERGPFFQTCNIAYPRELLEEMSGFDESYPLPGGEDTEFAWRALNAGHEIQFAEDAVVRHAVVDYGPIGKLRWALHWAPAMQLFADQPQLRRLLIARVFWKRSHALLTLALVGALFARRFPPAIALVLPYMREVRARCIVDDFSTVWAPYLALYDVLEVFAATSGSIRRGTFVV